MGERCACFRAARLSRSCIFSLRFHGCYAKLSNFLVCGREGGECIHHGALGCGFRFGFCLGLCSASIFPSFPHRLSLSASPRRSRRRMNHAATRHGTNVPPIPLCKLAVSISVSVPFPPSRFYSHAVSTFVFLPSVPRDHFRRLFHLRHAVFLPPPTLFACFPRRSMNGAPASFLACCISTGDFVIRVCFSLRHVMRYPLLFGSRDMYLVVVGLFATLRACALALSLSFRRIRIDTRMMDHAPLAITHTCS